MSRLAKIFLAVIIGLAVILIVVGRFSSRAVPESSPTPTLIFQEEAISPDPSVAGVAKVADGLMTVSRVIDGDTIELENGQKVRYIGIDTPESLHPHRPVECLGKESFEKNRALVEGKRVRLEKDVSETDRYGRLLRYVYVDNVMINDVLVREGFAAASAYPPDVKYQAQLNAAEKSARDNKWGLWVLCATPTPTVAGTNASTTSVAPLTSPQASVAPAPLSSQPSDTSCVIKGNISAAGEKIYHMPGCGSYTKTQIDESRGEKVFCTEGEATAAGWRKAKNC